MKKFTLTDPATGTQHHGRLPEGWHEVPLSAFLAFHQRHAGHREELAPYHAVMVLSGLPEQLFREDVGLAAGLAPGLLFYFDGLPAGDPAPTITHLGTTYQHQGDFSTLTAGQFEALLAFIDAAEGEPMQAAPHLLAVLYQQASVEQTSQTVAATAEAFQSLPVSVAWPAVGFFLQTCATPALRFQAFSAAKMQVETALTTLETVLTSARNGASPARLSGMRGWLASQFVRSVRGRLRSF